MSASAFLLERGFASSKRALLRQCDRNPVQAHGVVEDQLVERFFPERRLRRSMSHLLRVRPRAVQTREVAGPQEVAHSDFGHTPEAALLLDLESEEELASDELARLVGKRDVGLEDAIGRIAEFVFPVKAPEQKRDPPDPGLFEDEP